MEIPKSPPLAVRHKGGNIHQVSSTKSGAHSRCLLNAIVLYLLGRTVDWARECSFLPQVERSPRGSPRCDGRGLSVI